MWLKAYALPEIVTVPSSWAEAGRASSREAATAVRKERASFMRRETLTDPGRHVPFRAA